MIFYRHNAEHCFGPAGLDKSAHGALMARLEPALAELKARRDPKASPLLELPSRSDDLASIETLAAEIRKNFKYLVVIGSGGSGLSGRALAVLKPGNHLHFLETIDPDAIDDLLARIDVAQTCFLIISKSGATAETLGQFHVFFEQAKKNARQFIVITTPDGNPLHSSAKTHGLRVLDYDAAIGGRFAILTNVGLLPAAVAGLDIGALRRGAQSVVAALDKAKNAAECLPAMGAALQYGLLEKGRTISVMLPYGERLAGFSSWYRQCWAESLGKGGKGSTPIRGIGTTDQHSQLQLYLDGPKDKLFHLIAVKRAGKGHKVQAPDTKELGYLRGKTTGDIMAAEQKATLETLVRHRCPVRVFELETLNEEALGALFMHFTLEIIFMSRLLGVNPFDQPAVEESKRLAREYLLTNNL